MKFTLSFKTPDVLDQLNCSIDANDFDKSHDEAVEFARDFLQYDENITIEFDTKAKTAVAVRR